MGNVLLGLRGHFCVTESRGLTLRGLITVYFRGSVLLSLLLLTHSRGDPNLLSLHSVSLWWHCPVICQRVLETYFGPFMQKHSLKAKIKGENINK